MIDMWNLHRQLDMHALVPLSMMYYDVLINQYCFFFLISVILMWLWAGASTSMGWIFLNILSWEQRPQALTKSRASTGTRKAPRCTFSGLTLKFLLNSTESGVIQLPPISKVPSSYLGLVWFTGHHWNVFSRKVMLGYIILGKVVLAYLVDHGKVA